ncbi:MAG: alanine racemase [Frankia sp.]|nr:alanine racemase [Frankia sp.]
MRHDAAVELPPSAAPLAAVPAEALPVALRAALAAPRPEGVAETSAYYYDPAVAAANAAALRAALPPWAEIRYAVKANGFPPVLDALLRGGAHGFEVASVREIELARAAARRGGLGDGEVPLVAAGPGKSVSLLSALVAAGVEVVNVESELELRRLDAVAAAAGRRVPVALRVNPAQVAVTGSLRMGGVPSAFGIPEARVPQVLATAATLRHVEVVGFHLHAVSGNLDAARHVDYVRWCLDFATAAAAAARLDLRVVDVGGGFGVPFEADRRGERPFDLAAFGAGLRRLAVPAGVRVLFEPGRLLVADCGWYAAEVTDVKHAYGVDFVVLRGGIAGFALPISWEIVHNFAVVPRAGWPAGLPRPGVRDRPVTVVGELCTPEDTLARDITVDEVRAGDVVVFPMAGAYGYEFALRDFLGHPPPARLVLGG